MSRAVTITAFGGPEVLRFVDLEVAAPGPGQARLRHSHVGLNFLDVYQRTGLYKNPLPFTPGSEGAGVVTAVGPGVTDVKVGDRVAYEGGPPGAYADERLIAADRLVQLPAHIKDETAAAIMLKGMTTRYLVRQCHDVQAGDVILFHAAAGGVGLLACQWAKHLGATVIGTVGSAEKAELARAHGCDHVIDYTRERFVERVKEITSGKGVRAVYDGVGKDTLLGSLECLQPRGMLVLFGQSSGPPAPLDIGLLAKSSLFFTRPSLFAYTASRAELLANAADLFQVIESGAVKITPPRVRPLAEVAAAHADLEARRTTGATVFAV